MARLAREGLRFLVAALVLGGAPTALVPALAIAQSAPAVAPGAEAFARFWDRFRAALLAGRFTEVARMTRFPVETHGPADSDPIRLHPQSGLAALLRQALTEDSGLSLHPPLTNRAVVEHAAVPQAADPGTQIGADRARLGPFRFALTPAGWRLVRIDSAEDHPW